MPLLQKWLVVALDSTRSAQPDRQGSTSSLLSSTEPPSEPCHLFLVSMHRSRKNRCAVSYVLVTVHCVFRTVDYILFPGYHALLHCFLLYCALLYCVLLYSVPLHSLLTAVLYAAVLWTTALSTTVCCLTGRWPSLIPFPRMMWRISIRMSSPFPPPRGSPASAWRARNLFKGWPACRACDIGYKRGQVKGIQI